MPGRVFDLEDRLVKFAISILSLSELLSKTTAGSHLCGQLVRSGTAPALNYAEAQAAESNNDFIHKMRICLKELRETQVSLKIIKQKPFLSPQKVESLFNECSELVAIFSTSIKTASQKK